MSIDRLRHEVITNCRAGTNPHRSCLVGISGIDASGKGFIASKLATELEDEGYRVALINVDGWLNLPHIRFSRAGDEGLHFYKHALRLDEMFSRLILPLKKNRSIKLTMDYVDETATDFRPHTYEFDDIAVLLLEGIFIFKRAFVRHFDLKIWIDSSFDTALERAIARGQEGLSPHATIEAYTKIYFPAQRLHFNEDDPWTAADLIYAN